MAKKTQTTKERKNAVTSESLAADMEGPAAEQFANVREAAAVLTAAVQHTDKVPLRALRILRREVNQAYIRALAPRKQEVLAERKVRIAERIAKLQASLDKIEG